jgi:hypothetical protein
VFAATIVPMNDPIESPAIARRCPSSFSCSDIHSSAALGERHAPLRDEDEWIADRVDLDGALALTVQREVNRQ